MQHCEDMILLSYEFCECACTYVQLCFLFQKRIPDISFPFTEEMFRLYQTHSEKCLDLFHMLVCMFLFTEGPDEVIYDDVPRENSGSTTGLFIYFFIVFNAIKNVYVY